MVSKTQKDRNVNFNLSDKMGLKEYPVRDAFTKEDVKTFIYLLKKEIKNKIDFHYMDELNNFDKGAICGFAFIDDMINELAGKELLE